MEEFEYLEVSISEINNMLKQGLNIEVSSPNGYVKVLDYIEKTDKKLYKIYAGKYEIVCSFDHLFMTKNGWIKCEDLYNDYILCEDGNFYLASRTEYNKNSSVIDLSIDHPSHAYYTGGMVSHNTNVGKSAIMCAHAAQALRDMHNVLYVTFEDSEDKIATRIIMNLMDMNKMSLKNLGRTGFLQQYQLLRNQYKSKLFIKEYPEMSACANTIKGLLKELKNKKKFEPEIIFLDYVGCMCSNLKKNNTQLQTHEMLKHVVAENRAIGMEYNIPIVTGLQLNRGGNASQNPGLTDVADSFAQATKFDTMFNFWQSDEDRTNGIINIKLNKSRHGKVGQGCQIRLDVEKQKIISLNNKTAVKAEQDYSLKELNNVSETKPISKKIDWE